MREIALTKGVEFRERVMITDLLTSDGSYPTRGQAIGAVGLNTRSGEFMVFRSKAVIIATGHTGIKVNTTYSNGLCGDGLSIAFRAGAELAGMEFQSPFFGFWNRKFPTGGQQQFLMNQAKIVNRIGERFMERYMASESDFISPSASQIKQLQRESTSPLRRETKVNPDKMYFSLQKTLVPYGASFFKNEKRIRGVLKELEGLSQALPHLSASDAHELIKANEFRNCLQVMSMLFTAAMERKESRFGHYREEYPYRDDREWLKWIILKSDGKDGISVRLERVPFDKYPLKPPVLRHIPSFTRYTLK